MSAHEMVFLFGDTFFRVFFPMMLFTAMVGMLSIVAALLVAVGRVLAVLL